jgi:hypothetical protein
MSASNFNINVTNLTNSLVVTQNNNNHNNANNNPLDIPKKIKIANHKKSKSQGQKTNSTNLANAANLLLKKTPLPMQSYKTSHEFYDSQLRKKK